MKAGMSARFHASACALMAARISVSSGGADRRARVRFAPEMQARRKRSRARSRKAFHRRASGWGVRVQLTMAACCAAETSPFRVVHTVCSHDCPDSCAVLVTVDAKGVRSRCRAIRRSR